MPPRITAEVIEDSICDGVRITTIQYRAWRAILAEINTHGVIARSARSTRAVPTKRLIAEVRETPFVPARWYENGPGMAGKAPLVGWRRTAAVAVWRLGALSSIATATALNWLGVHKQHAGRPLEPYMWVDGVITATEWENFFNLRISAGAQPEFDELAKAVKFALDTSDPVERTEHLPYVTEAERVTRGSASAFLVSARRCAAVSYRPFTAKPSGAAWEEDVAKGLALLRDGHMSPFDHPALTTTDWRPCRFAAPWLPYRKTIPNEENPLGAKAPRA